MQLRAPAYPLITVDPFFSVWSPADRLTDVDTAHWTGYTNAILGTAEIDGKTYRFMGKERDGVPAMEQVSVDMDAFTTTYVYEAAGVRLTLLFTSPILPDDFYYLTRPVSYLSVQKEITDRHKHTVSFKIAVSEQICMNLAGDDEVVCEELTLGNLSSVKMGTKSQNILGRYGDDLRIEWGYFYLSGKGETFVAKEDMTFVGI